MSAAPDPAPFFDRIYELALQTENAGNLPIAAILTDGTNILAEGVNRTLAPVYHPGRHAEMEAMRLAPESVWSSGADLTIYTSLEPCMMCFGSIVLHRIRRVVYAAPDPLGGALSLLPSLSGHIGAKSHRVSWLGPVQPERFAPLTERALLLGTPYREPSGP
jgi:tRNA(adenine34) deaminase